MNFKSPTTMRKINSFLLLLMLTFLCPALAQAQLQRSEAFKGKYKLKEVVILSRHNIRSPLSTNGSALSKMTPHEWTNWSSASSELTLRGGVLETEMGQFFRKWTIETGLFKENYVPSIDEVNVYANSMQRCIATAQYFTSGFMPVANLRVNHRYVPSKMDPIFFPRLTKSTEAFRTEAMKQINAMGGKELTTEDWTKIAKVKDVYGDVLFTAPIVAVNVAHPLLQYMYDELNDKDRKFTFLCGHDSNIASVDAALGVEEYSLPNSIEKKTPIGSKLVLEKWVDAAGKAYIAVNLVYQSTDQLKQMSLLDLQHAPQVFSLKLKGLSQNTDGLYTFEDVNARFLQAIRAYDDIK